MVRTRCALGLGLLALGSGMILAVLLQTGIFSVILGVLFLGVGVCLLWGNGA